MAGSQSVNRCDPVVLTFRHSVLCCAHLNLGVTENEVQSWGQGTSEFLKTMISEVKKNWLSSEG